jgi:DNA primase small subunit
MNMQLVSCETSKNGRYAGQMQDARLHYYTHLFPYDDLATWLRYNREAGEFFAKREFAFALADERVLRYHRYTNVSELRAAVRRLQPAKIDLGAMLFPGNVLRKEIIVDIDWTDYDGLRRCCQGTAVCRSCWRFISVAINIVDYTLRNDFGFVSLFWVFSGRRGVHCWVCDEAALSYTDDQRVALVEYFDMAADVPVRPERMHLPLSEHPHPIIRNMASEFATYYSYVVECNPNPTDITSSSESVRAEKMYRFIRPRLDKKVTMQIGHLLKSPWAVHPETGKVCVPVYPSTADSFDPSQVPTVEDLARQPDLLDDYRISWAETFLCPFQKWAVATEPMLCTVTSPME